MNDVIEKVTELLEIARKIENGEGYEDRSLLEFISERLEDTLVIVRETDKELA